MSINDAQSVRLEKGATESKNYFKQLPVPFKVYADFECNIDSVDTYEGSYSKKYQDHIPSGFAFKLVCVDNKFSMGTEVKMLLRNLFKQFLKSMNTVRE